MLVMEMVHMVSSTEAGWYPCCVWDPGQRQKAKGHKGPNPMAKSGHDPQGAARCTTGGQPKGQTQGSGFQNQHVMLTPNARLIFHFWFLNGEEELFCLERRWRVLHLWASTSSSIHWSPTTSRLRKQSQGEKNYIYIYVYVCMYEEPLTTGGIRITPF